MKLASSLFQMLRAYATNNHLRPEAVTCLLCERASSQLLLVFGCVETSERFHNQSCLSENPTLKAAEVNSIAGAARSCICALESPVTLHSVTHVYETIKVENEVRKCSHKTTGDFE